jgi:hypothetical protein
LNFSIKDVFLEVKTRHQEWSYYNNDDHSLSALSILDIVLCYTYFLQDIPVKRVLSLFSSADEGSGSTVVTELVSDGVSFRSYALPFCHLGA